MMTTPKSLSTPTATPPSVRARLSGGLSFELPGDLCAGEVRARVAEELGVAEEHLELIDDKGTKLDDSVAFGVPDVKEGDPGSADAAAGSSPASVDLLAVILDAAEQAVLQITGVDDIADLSDLSRLDLNGRQLRELPQSLRELTALVELDASHNQLSAVPEIFDSLKDLKELNLRSNRIAHLPFTLTSGAALQVLDVAHNNLYLLPGEMGDLANLLVLDMSHNQLCGLPQSIFCLPNLQRLDLSHNELELLPMVIDLNSLESLNLSHNLLWALHDEFGSEMRSLSELDLCHNRLTYLPWSFFDFLGEVGRIDLSHNRLATMPLSARRVAWAEGVDLRGNTWPAWSLLLASRAVAMAGEGCRCRPRAWGLSSGGAARQPTFAEEAARDGMREALNTIAPEDEVVEAQPASDEAE